MNKFVIYKTPEFVDWLEGVRDMTTYIRLLRRIEKAQRGLLGDTKSVGGGDKGSQQIDIAAAKFLATQIEDHDP